MAKKAAYVKMVKSHERTQYEVHIQFGNKYVSTVALILCGVVGEKDDVLDKKFGSIQRIEVLDSTLFYFLQATHPFKTMCKAIHLVMANSESVWKY